MRVSRNACSRIRSISGSFTPGSTWLRGRFQSAWKELYEKEKKRSSRSALSIEQLLEQLKSESSRVKRSASRTEINKRFSFPFSCLAFALIAVPLGVTAHRRETSIGFAMGLIVAVTYFLFVIVGDTLRSNSKGSSRAARLAAERHLPAVLGAPPFPAISPPIMFAGND